jgi:hypothetical protein
MMVFGYTIPRENEHHENRTPQGDVSYIEGILPPLRDFTKWSEDGKTKCPSKCTIACKRKDDIDNSLQLEIW